jgi:L-aminopeptidase/D-esterase-like protein
MTKPRARDLGIPFEGNPGKYNTITDVEGITVVSPSSIHADETTTSPCSRRGFPSTATVR